MSSSSTPSNSSRAEGVTRAAKKEWRRMCLEEDGEVEGEAEGEEREVVEEARERKAKKAGRSVSSWREVMRTST